MPARKRSICAACFWKRYSKRSPRFRRNSARFSLHTRWKVAVSTTSPPRRASTLTLCWRANGTRCSRCAVDSRTYTTSFLRNEAYHETQMDLRDCTFRHCAVRLGFRRDRDASVELASPRSVRLAHHYFLAGAGPAGPLPHPLRRLRRRWPRGTSPSAEGDVGGHDAAGARTIPAAGARAVRSLWRARQREQRARLRLSRGGG